MIPQYDLDGLGAEYIVTEQLEREFAAYFGVKHCIMVTSGTAALFLVLRAVGAKKVAVPPLTMFATATAAEMAGCDISFVSGNELDQLPSDIDTYVHVSLNGRDCGIKEVLAKFPNITIIEDACQSFGSMHEGKYLGTFGKAGCFSFSPHKIISAGNGGCVVTDNDELALAVRRLKNFGREKGGADQFEHIGYNFKFTDVQARFMLPQWQELPQRLEKKKAMYKRYQAALGDLMRPHNGVPWFVDIYHPNRDALAQALKEKGIGTRLMYPLIPTQKPFASYPIYGDSSQDKLHAEQGLWLPSSLSLTDAQIDEVIEAVHQSRI